MSEQNRELGAELDQLFPGRDVAIGAAKVRVFPAGVVHIKKFARALGMLANKLQRIPRPHRPNAADPDGPAVVDWGELVPLYVPHVIDALTGDLIDLVFECCQPNPVAHRVPHWFMADILIAWFEENFGEERRIHPWVRAVETVLEKMTKEKVDLWSTLSRSLSPAAIQKMRSSVASTLGARTPDGPSPSSGPTPERPPEPSGGSAPTP